MSTDSRSVSLVDPTTTAAASSAEEPAATTTVDISEPPPAPRASEATVSISLSSDPQVTQISQAASFQALAAALAPCAEWELVLIAPVSSRRPVLFVHASLST